MQPTVLGIAGVIVGLVAAEMLKEAVRREYGSWAPGLARAMVRLAGLIHPSRAAEWRADILYLQTQGQSGLWEAACYLLAAPKLLLRESLRKLRGLELRRRADGGRVDWSVVSWVGLDDGFTAEIRAGLRDGRGHSRNRLGSVYRAGNWLAGDPQEVSLTWSQNGAFSGMAVSGAETLAFVTSPSHYERHVRKPPLGCDIFLATPEAFAALRQLADSVDPDRVGKHREGCVHIAFWDRWQATSSCECCSGGRLDRRRGP